MHYGINHPATEVDFRLAPSLLSGSTEDIGLFAEASGAESGAVTVLPDHDWLCYEC